VYVFVRVGIVRNITDHQAMKALLAGRCRQLRGCRDSCSVCREKMLGTSTQSESMAACQDDKRCSSGSLVTQKDCFEL